MSYHLYANLTRQKKYPVIHLTLDFAYPILPYFRYHERSVDDDKGLGSQFDSQPLHLVIRYYLPMLSKVFFIKPHSHPNGFLLGSPMLMDPHSSQQHAGLQRAV